MGLAPFFSIIVPTYNRAKIIEQMVESLILQSIYDWELIIVDDGSTDETEQILEKYISKIPLRYIPLPFNRGPNFARNVGIEEAKGKWLIFHDSDNFFTPYSLKLIQRAIKEHNSLFFFGQSVNLKGKPLTNRPNWKGKLGYREYICGKIRGEYHPIVNREGLGDLRYPTDIVGGEHLLWAKLIKKVGQVYILNRPTQIYNDQLKDRLSIRKKNLNRLATVFKRDLEELGRDYLVFCPMRWFQNWGKYLIYLVGSKLVRKG